MKRKLVETQRKINIILYNQGAIIKVEKRPEKTEAASTSI